MTDFKAIYQTQATQYNTMVAHEDYQGNILQALQKIRPFSGLTVVELGAGTGRLTRLLTPLVKTIYAFDISPAMLREATQTMSQANLAVGDNRNVPIQSKTADLIIAGWSLGHSVGWYPATWQTEIGKVLTEAERVLRPGGTFIILETLGTGQETPRPPAEHLAGYYRWLENEHTFARTWIRTDYRFETAEQAADLTRFFFGDTLADHILHHQLTILPECTGIWWKTIAFPNLKPET